MRLVNSSRAFLLLTVLSAALRAQAASKPGVERVVIIKVDGLPANLIEQYIAQPSDSKARAGKSRLPWIDRVFRENGVWFENFYTRGISLSAPSWSMLDTGRHLEIHGNVEYDRYTLRPYDYLNFFPFYVSNAEENRVDSRGVEVLDELGIPLLLDRFALTERFEGYQLLQRDAGWATLQSTLKRFVSRPPKELLDEWITGFSMSDSLNRQTEAELIAALKNPNIHYLDYFTGEFDHTAHLTTDPISQFRAIEEVDSLVGRIWTAISRSPLADRTALILISDHGINTSPTTYSQGFNFVDWFRSPSGGSQNVLTNRHPLTEFKLKGLDPFVSAVVSQGRESSYLAGKGDRYPTVSLDLDGNERASIGLRNNTLNMLQILLDQLLNKAVSGTMRASVVDTFFQVLDSVREAWHADMVGLTTDLADLDQTSDRQAKKIAARAKTLTDVNIDAALDKDFRRMTQQLQLWQSERGEYFRYVDVMKHLLDLKPSDFDPGKFKLEVLIPTHALGPLNSLRDLQNYVVGLGPQGIVLDSDHKLDFKRSFATIDYFSALASLKVRNNVQSGVATQPVDFVAVRVPASSLPAKLAKETARDAIWLHRDADHQALVLSRQTPSGMELRYLPVAHLTARQDGALAFDTPAIGPGFPLALYEDPKLDTKGASCEDWLTQWHSERDWFDAVHQTRYSNGIIGLIEQLNPVLNPEPPFQDRKRALRRTDLLIFANDHWNFNVRGFNPGGNHGSFLRNSTHSVLMIAGGKASGIPQGQKVATPYDSLNFVPTILDLMGRPEPDLPGMPIKELVPILDH